MGRIEDALNLAKANIASKMLQTSPICLIKPQAISTIPDTYLGTFWYKYAQFSTKYAQSIQALVMTTCKITVITSANLQEIDLN